MKRLVREAKDEVEILRSENERIKKSIKYTRYSEMESENKSIEFVMQLCWTR